MSRFYQNLKHGKRLISWLFLDTFKGSRNKLFKISFFSMINFFIQSILATSIVLCSKIINKEDITFYNLNFSTEKITIFFPIIIIFFVMSSAASLNFFYNKILREFGRYVNIKWLKEVFKVFDSNNDQIHNLDVYSKNRLIYQAPLHAGLLMESILRLIFPVLTMLSGFLALLLINPFLILILLLSIIPILPIYIKRSRDIYALSNRFYSETNNILTPYINSFVNFTSGQNLFSSEKFVKNFLKNQKTKKYFDDFDSVSLADDRMNLIISSYRPFVLSLIILYLYFINASPLMILPNLLAIFLITNGALNFSTILTSITRFLPQVKLLYEVNSLNKFNFLSDKKLSKKIPDFIGIKFNYLNKNDVNLLKVIFNVKGCFNILFINDNSDFIKHMSLNKKNIEKFNKLRKILNFYVKNFSFYTKKNIEKRYLKEFKNCLLMINDSKCKIIDISFLNKINNKSFLQLKKSYLKDAKIIVNFDEKNQSNLIKKNIKDFYVIKNNVWEKVSINTFMKAVRADSLNTDINHNESETNLIF